MLYWSKIPGSFLLGAGLTFYSFERLKQLLLDYCPLCRLEDGDNRQVTHSLSISQCCGTVIIFYGSGSGSDF
jgi:hypothetical protein